MNEIKKPIKLYFLTYGFSITKENGTTYYYSRNFFVVFLRKILFIIKHRATFWKESTSHKNSTCKLSWW